jgi:hypothetical protein
METAPMGELLEAAGRLSLDEQETLLEILHRRMIERRRAELVKDVENARHEFQQGGCPPTTPGEVTGATLS